MKEQTNPEINFESEIKFLDLIYTDMLEAIHQKPDENDIEAMRLYMDNIWGVFNRTVFRVTEIKNSLQKNQKLIHETWNPPA
jgi:hypothetical protein